MGKFNEFLGKCGGKKFVVAVTSAIAIFLATRYGISEDTTLKIAGVASAFIFGQGLADFGTGGKTSSVAALAERVKDVE